MNIAAVNAVGDKIIAAHAQHGKGKPAAQEAALRAFIEGLCDVGEGINSGPGTGDEKMAAVMALIAFNRTGGGIQLAVDGVLHGKVTKL